MRINDFVNWFSLHHDPRTLLVPYKYKLRGRRTSLNTLGITHLMYIHIISELQLSAWDERVKQGREPGTNQVLS